MKKGLLTLALTIFAGASVAQAFPQFELLGSTKLENQRDYDFIPVNSCNGFDPDRVSAIRLHIRGDAARIDSVTVQFKNGRLDSLPVGGVYAAGTSTGLIDLKGRNRCITNIQIVGKSVGPRARQSVVDIYGLVQDLGHGRPNRPHRPRWP